MVRVLLARRARKRRREEEEEAEAEEEQEQESLKEEWGSQVPVGRHRTFPFPRSHVHK